MIERLIRIGLALAVAFVFTGRMEAAVAHCARLAVEEQAVPQHEATPCHSMDEAASSKQASHHPAKQDPARHNPAQSQCECIAVLAGFTSFAPSVASAHIEPYEWMRPQAAAFASIEPSPGLRPPRA